MIDRYSKIIKDFVDDAITVMSNSTPTNIKVKSGMEPFVGDTVTVMERFNLHDALMRMPANHRELGPNSRAGRADHLCLRRMNQVPLSDFFAASSSKRERESDGPKSGGSLALDG